MKKALLTFFLLMPIGALLGMGGQSIPMGAIPASVSGGSGSDFTTGLVEHWPMNEGTGTTNYTTTGTGNNLTTSNLTWTTGGGFPGSIQHFPNSGVQYAVGSVSTDTDFEYTDSFTVCSWENADNYDDQQQLVGNESTAGGFPGWEMGFISGTLNFGLLHDAGSLNYIYVNAAVVPATGTLIQTCASYDGSNTAAGIKLYMNGSPLSVTIVQDSLSGSIKTGIPVDIGAVGSPGGANYFRGSIGYVAIWNVVKTPTQIANYYAAGPQ